MRSFRHILLIAAMSGLAACTGEAPPAKLAVHPVIRGASQEALSGPDYYSIAVKAIEDRDYVLALEYLQLSRARSTNDPRVLNAFGVVYDKLGRFDLSKRYYSQALAADPGSSIVTANLAYSNMLQLHPRQIAVASLPGIGGIPAASVQRMAAVKTTSIPLKIVNASGVRDADASIRNGLAHLNWKVGTSAQAALPAEKITRLVYPRDGRDVAQALSRTLPFPTRLVVDDGRATAIRLIVGADFLRWKIAPGKLPEHWRKELQMAANTPQRRGRP